MLRAIRLERENRSRSVAYGPHMCACGQARHAFVCKGYWVVEVEPIHATDCPRHRGAPVIHLLSGWSK